MKTEIGNVLRRFVNTCGCTLIIMVILGPVAHVIDGLSNAQIACLVLCDAAAALSSLVFLAKEELHGGAWWIREVLCIAINMAITLPLTHAVGLWRSALGMLLVMGIILVIAFGNHLIEYLFDLHMANRLNRKIQELR